MKVTDFINDYNEEQRKRQADIDATLKNKEDEKNRFLTAYAETVKTVIKPFIKAAIDEINGGTEAKASEKQEVISSSYGGETYTISISGLGGYIFQFDIMGHNHNRTIGINCLQKQVNKQYSTNENKSNSVAISIDTITKDDLDKELKSFISKTLKATK